MSKEFEISEINKLIKDLDRKGMDIRKGIKKGTSKTGFSCTKIAIKLAPVSNINGGQLRASIHTTIEEKNNSINVESSPNTEYEVYPEFGTGQRGMASKIDRPDGISYSADWKGQDAQPYMYPAYIQTRDKLLSNIKKELNKVLKN